MTRRHPPTTKHRYLAKLLEIQRDGMFPAGSITDVEVRHERWCDFHRGAGCNCDAEILLRPIAPHGCV